MDCLAGVKSGKINDSQMTASSQWVDRAGHEAHAARLDGPTGWTPIRDRQSNDRIV